MTQNEAAEISTALRLTGDFVCDILKVILENEEKYEKKCRCDFVHCCLCGDFRLGTLLFFRCDVS